MPLAGEEARRPPGQRPPAVRAPHQPQSPGFHRTGLLCSGPGGDPGVSPLPAPAYAGDHHAAGCTPLVPRGLRAHRRAPGFGRCCPRLSRPHGQRPLLRGARSPGRAGPGAMHAGDGGRSNRGFGQEPSPPPYRPREPPPAAARAASNLAHDRRPARAMILLIVSDHEERQLYEHFDPERWIGKIDLAISCGDLRADYLSYLVTVLRVRLLYVAD